MNLQNAFVTSKNYLFSFHNSWVLARWVCWGRVLLCCLGIVVRGRVAIDVLIFIE